MRSSEFMQSRVDYLQTLPDIGIGWISDGQNAAGLPPTPAVCSQAQKLLRALQDAGLEYTPATLLMGPIPAGGIELELRLRAGTAFLSLFNSGRGEASFGWMNPDWGEQELPAAEAIQYFESEVRRQK